jgi:3-oxoacyl-[acyl-carrier-protein] synthase III
MRKFGVKMRGIGVSLPETIVTNDDLTSLVETSDEWISSRTGFRQRHVVSGDQLVTDLAIECSQNALAFAGMTGEDIDLIIYGSSTPDYIYPAGCGVVQQGIGAVNAFGFDVAMGCSGLIYCMGIAMQFLENGTVKNALVLGADTHSRYTDWHDRNTAVLFGDGAGAFVLSRTDDPADTDILSMDFMLDGSKGQQIKLPINRDNCPLVEPRKYVEKSAIYMNGREVFKFAVGDVPRIIEASLAKLGLKPKDVDHFVLHQANARIMTSMVERMDIRPEQVVVSLENYGNTSAASIPLALNDAVESGQVQPGHTVVLCGFGAGLAAATTVVKWSCVDQRKNGAGQAKTQQSVETV